MSTVCSATLNKNDDESISAGNLHLTITTVSSNTNLSSQKKIKKADALSSANSVPQEKEQNKASKPPAITKIQNSLAIVPSPSLIPYIETPWTIIGSYFRNQHLKRLVRHQIESYNDFVNNQIQRTIEMFNPVLIASEQDYCRKSKKINSSYMLHLTNLIYIVHKYMKTMELQKLCFHMMQELGILHMHQQ